MLGPGSTFKLQAIFKSAFCFRWALRHLPLVITGMCRWLAHAHSLCSTRTQPLVNLGCVTISPPCSPSLVYRFLISIKQGCDLKIQTTGPPCSLIMDVVTSNDTIQTKRAPFGGKAYIHRLYSQPAPPWLYYYADQAGGNGRSFGQKCHGLCCFYLKFSHFH